MTLIKTEDRVPKHHTKLYRINFYFGSSSVGKGKWIEKLGYYDVSHFVKDLQYETERKGLIEMKFNETTIRILVRKNYGDCFDFYTEKMGLIPVWGDRNGPYTSFAASADAPPCFAIFEGAAMPMFKGYEQPDSSVQPDTVVAVIPTLDLDGDYQRLKEAGVHFLGEPQYIEAWGMRCTYFRDPEGNLFELNNDSGV